VSDAAPAAAPNGSTTATTSGDDTP
jgi:hypothetical protein